MQARSSLQNLECGLCGNHCPADYLMNLRLEWARPLPARDNSERAITDCFSCLTGILPLPKAASAWLL
jgi:hypothetical protein